MNQRFSFETRAANIAAMGAETVDLLVIGAGVVGAAIARDAAMRGISTVIVDRGDFASGVSERSCRVVGGAPPFHLSRGSLRAIVGSARGKRALLDIAPHLVQPQSFLFPLHDSKGRSVLRLRINLWLNDLFTRSRKLPRHRWLSRRAFLRVEPRLKERGLKGGVRYADAVCDAARLVLATVRSGHQHGALAANYVNVESLDVADGRVRGAHVVDLVTGTAQTIHARMVVSAAGQWTEHMGDHAPGHGDYQLRKEIQVSVPRQRVGNRVPLTVESPIDGRMMYLIPSASLSTICATTVTVADGCPQETYADEAEVVYLLRSANAVFPDARLKPSDVVSTWAGVFPIPKDRVGASGRDRGVFENPNGLISVFGSTLANQQRVAERTIDLVADRLHSLDGRPRQSEAATSRVPLPGGEVIDLSVLAEAAEREGVSRETAEHLVDTFGSETPAVTRIALSDPALAEPIVPNHAAILAELVHSMRREMALTLSDLLARRLHLRFETPNQVLDRLESIADVAANEMGWDEARRTAELAVYRATGDPETQRQCD